MADLLKKRRRDLETQLESLPRELAIWEQRTLQADFEKHRSQVVALSRQMRELNRVVRDTWGQSDDFISIRIAQNNCAAVQSVWSYFREKLLLRFDPDSGPFLRAADAYVWSCYEPVLKSRRMANPTQTFREPPLVTFNAQVSPWAESRHPATDKSIPMPIAVLGIPWSMIEILPNIAALAHETGHIVESDFGLQAALESALREATQHSPLSEGWSVHWRKEVFADLFACFAAGPSSLWTLTEAIPEAPDQVETRKRPPDITSNEGWGTYPPATLRVLMNLHALRKLGHVREADQLEQYWKADYPKHAMAAYEDDVKLVVDAVYAAAQLPHELNWKRLAGEFKGALDDVTWADLKVDKRYDPRLLVAIAGDVYRSPKGADVSKVWERVRDHIVKSRPPGVLASQKERIQDGEPVYLRTAEIARALFTDDPDEP